MASIEIKWKKMGSEFTYNILYATKIIGPWIQHNSDLLTDALLDIRNDGDPNYATSLEHYYSIEDLKDNTKYFVKVTCDDRYYQWWYSYSDVDTIEGGFGSSFNRPVSPGGNYVGFQVNI